MKAISKVILFFAYLIIISIIIEFYFRISGISEPSFIYDSLTLGRTHMPGREIFQASAEGFCIDEVNKYGYTGNGYPLKKQKGTIRIALFGSSYVEGLQVFRRNRFSTILEYELSKKLNNKVEVLNFGIGGDDFRGMFFRYLDLGRKYEPDYFIFLIQSQALTKKKTIPSPEIYTKNDSLKISDAFLNNSETKLREKFKLVRNYALGNFIKEGFEVYYDGRLPSIILDKLYSSKKNDTTKKQIDKDHYYLINKKILDFLNNENKIYNKNIIIVKIDELSDYYNNYLDSINFPLIDLNKKLSTYGKNKINFWKASGIIGHWNNFAHGIVGVFLTNELYFKINSSR